MRSKHLIITAVIGCIFTAVSGGAQTLQRIALPTQRLLPMSGISNVMQDEDGYMWYATLGCGLLRDDGYHVDVFRTDRLRPTLMANNDVLCLAENRARRQIWFGTRAGAFLLDKRNYEIRPVVAGEHRVKGRHVEVMLSTTDNTMWMAVRDSILHFADSGDLLGAYASTWQGRDAIVTSLAEMPTGDLLVTQWDGGWGMLLRRSDGQYTFEELPWSQLTCPTTLAFDRRNDCWWMGTWGDGLFRVNFEEDSVNLFPQTIASHHLAEITRLYVDGHRHLLWVTHANGLAAFNTDGKQLTPVDLSALQLPTRAVLSDLYADHAGNLYVAGQSPQTFIIPRTDPAIQCYTGTEAESLFSHADNLIATSDGLLWTWQKPGIVSCFNPATARVVTAPAAAPAAAYTYVMTVAANGGIWVATETGDICRLVMADDGIHLHEVIHAEQPDILSMADDGCGHIYVGTRTRFLCYHLRQGVLIALSEQTGMVRDIKVAADHRIGLISTQQGFCMLDAKTDTLQVLAPYLQFNKMAFGNDGDVWLSSSSGSLYCYNLSTSELAESPASSDNGDAIKNLAFDGHHLWLITDQAVREFSPARGTQRQLSASDRRIDLDDFVALTASADGAWVGGARGICHLQRSGRLDAEAPERRILLSAYELRGIRHPLADSIHSLIIPARESGEVGLYLTGSDHLANANVRFAFMLRGLSKEWVTLDKGENTIRLISLPKGTYTLMVRITDDDGLWSRPVEVLTLERLPFWWETWWARCLYVAIVAAILFAFYANYRRQRRRREQFDRLLRLLRESNRPASSRQEEDSLRENRRVPAFGQNESFPLTGEQGEDLLQEEGIELSPEDSRTLEQAIAAVQQHLDDTEYDIEGFARDMLMSRTTLFRRIRVVSGQSPTDFIKTVRLERAAQLITTTDHTIAAIADMTGFSSASYFSKCFKQKYGVLPKNYKG
ncbi:MAG: helix-turn-helix domain-containing protein [Bacteroidaceae bacterium]|nr:helix-turn-helix domain-containing protein [Bacteroidaceae bacterium]